MMVFLMLARIECHDRNHTQCSSTKNNGLHFMELWRLRDKLPAGVCSFVQTNIEFKFIRIALRHF